MPVLYSILVLASEIPLISPSFWNLNQGSHHQIIEFLEKALLFIRQLEPTPVISYDILQNVGS